MKVKKPPLSNDELKLKRKILELEIEELPISNQYKKLKESLTKIQRTKNQEFIFLESEISRLLAEKRRIRLQLEAMGTPPKRTRFDVLRDYRKKKGTN